MLWEFMVDSDIKLILKLPECSRSGLIRRVIPEIINACYTNPGPISEIAFRIGISTRTLERIFMNCIKCCPRDLISIIRIGVGGVMLVWHTEYSTDGIASICGFNTSVTFRRHFMNAVGISCSDFKKLVVQRNAIRDVHVGPLRARWKIPHTVTYDKFGVLITPIEFIISIQDDLSHD